MQVLDLRRVQYRDRFATFWQRILDAEAPKLQELHLNMFLVDALDSPEWEEDPDHGDLTIGPKFLQTSPELARVYLSGTHMSWNITSLTSIRSL